MPNNFVIENDYFIIPIGSRCGTATACKHANIRKFSLPFDWTIPLFPKKIKNVLENNFEDYIPDVHNNNFYNKYDFFLAHFNSNIENGIEEYKRRIIRFNDIINQQKKIYFVYFNEDYLYDNNYRSDEFNDNIFNEMIEFENFIKDKYININYNILYINFKHHNIPANSKILNVVLHTTNLYDTCINAPYAELRIFCGKILSELFNTNLSLELDLNIFNN
jgi:hypothetical protein